MTTSTTRGAVSSRHSSSDLAAASGFGPNQKVQAHQCSSKL
jgi:hypothetical protein